MIVKRIVVLAFAGIATFAVFPANAKEEPLAIWYSEDVERSGKVASVRENAEGYTEIHYHLPKTRSLVKSGVKRYTWEDSEGFAFYSDNKEIGRVDQYEGSLEVVGRLFTYRHVYYVLRSYLIAGEGRRFDQIEYKYEIYEIRATSSKHYTCEFKSRLPKIASDVQRGRVAQHNADGLYLEVLNSLAHDGADLVADKCRVVP